ncbi:hypothetical protein HYH02_009944 [Chlamydomonas schloesseri]|uniref:Uncharacterized protein n=1 Tax=Chlamydomonas schloesseri TaxID=2026947 RepID=A0A835T9F6_9CHLO|nr:hypothetical protein HYH02_009944 [Chlamydomonas schloesseri]|eukprot:KAG2441352.1 hypothetical protein HYH02_009944 [Chlamydomonas schloesseri]
MSSAGHSVGSLEGWLVDVHMRKGASAAVRSCLVGAGRGDCFAASSPLQRADSVSAQVTTGPAGPDLCLRAALPGLRGLSFGEFSGALCNEAALSHREEGLPSRAFEVLLFGLSDSESDDGAGGRGGDPGEEEDEILCAYGDCRGRHAAAAPFIGSSSGALLDRTHEADPGLGLGFGLGLGLGLGLVQTSLSGHDSSSPRLARRCRHGIVSSTGYVLAAPSAAAPLAFSSSSPSSSSSSDCAPGAIYGSLGGTAFTSGMFASASTTASTFASGSTAGASGGGGGTAGDVGFFRSLDHLEDQGQDQDRQRKQQQQQRDCRLQESVGCLDMRPLASAAAAGCVAAATLSTAGGGCGSSRNTFVTLAAAAAAASAAAVSGCVPAFSPLADSPSAAWLSRNAAKTVDAPAERTPSNSSLLLSASPVSFTAFAPPVCRAGVCSTPHPAVCAWPRLSEDGGHSSGRGGSGTAAASGAAAGAAPWGAATALARAEAAAGCATTAKPLGPYEGTVRGGNPRRHAASTRPAPAPSPTPLAASSARSEAVTGGRAGHDARCSISRLNYCSAVAAARTASPLSQEAAETQHLAAPPVALRPLCDMLSSALKRT